MFLEIQSRLITLELGARGRHYVRGKALGHLSLQAGDKQFHKALQDGDSATMDRVREGLPRLSADATVDDVTLMEAQQVLAREYGFRDWPPSPKGQ